MEPYRSLDRRAAARSALSISYSLRHPKPDDLTAIRQLLLNEMKVDTPLAVLASDLERVDRDLWVCVAESEAIIGWLSARFVAQEAELMEMVIAPQFRRMGLGGQMLDGFIERSRAAGGRTIHLEVRAMNQGAIAIYESRGFHRVGIRSGYYADGEDAVLYSLDLRSLG